MSSDRRLVELSYPGHEYWTPGIRYLCRRMPFHVRPEDVAVLVEASERVPEWRMYDQWGRLERTGPLLPAVHVRAAGDRLRLVEGRVGDLHRLLFDVSPDPLPTGVSVAVGTGSCVLGGDGEADVALAAGASAALDPHRLTAASGEWTVTPAGAAASWSVAVDEPRFVVQRRDGGGWADVAETAEFSGAAPVRLRPHP